MKVLPPSNPADAYGLLRSAIDDADPVLFIENMPGYWARGEAPAAGHRVPIGAASVVATGSDITIVGYSRMLNECRAALDPLREAGVSVELIDLRSIQPWDQETVCASVEKTGRLLVAHEAVTPFGVGAEIAAVVTERLFARLKAPVARLGAPFAPVPFTKPLEQAFLPNAEKIARRAVDLVQGPSR